MSKSGRCFESFSTGSYYGALTENKGLGTDEWLTTKQGLIYCRRPFVPCENLDNLWHSQTFGDA